MPLLDSPPEVVQRFHALGMSATRVEAVALGPCVDTAPLHPRMGGVLTMCLNGLAGRLEDGDPPGWIARDAACVEQLLCRGLPYMGVAYGAGPLAAELADAAVRLLRAVAQLEKRDAAELGAYDIEGRLSMPDSVFEADRIRECRAAWGAIQGFYVGSDWLGAVSSLAKSAVGIRRLESSGHLAFREWKRAKWLEKQGKRYRFGDEAVEESKAHEELRRERHRRSQELMHLQVEIDKRWGKRPEALATLQKVREGLTDRELGGIRFGDDGVTAETCWRTIQHEAKVRWRR